MITVRKARLEDTQDVYDLLSKVWQDDYVPHVWSEWVQQPEWGIVLVAEHNSQIVGTCYVHFMTNRACWLQAMRVHPDYRRLGVGSLLTQGCLAEIKAQGFCAAYLGIDSDNTASITMTKRQGFNKILDYKRLATKLPPKDSLPRSSTAWRQAVEDDIPAMLELCKANNCSQSVFARWEWEPLSYESLDRNVRQETLWVWAPGGEVHVWAGFEIFKPEYCLFAPCGSSSQAVLNAVDDLLGFIQGNEEAIIEVWMHEDDFLSKHLAALQFSEEDGYTIWKYSL